MKNLISIIIPVYNVEQYLSRCVDSVINQTYKNLEIILVDDGSTDNSGKICDEYALKDNRIKVIHKKNGGVSSARNAGLDIAKGDYIGFVDSDDFIEHDMYEYLQNLIIEYDADISICSIEFIIKNKNIYKTLLKKDELLNTNEALKVFYTQLYIYNKLFNKCIMADLLFDTSVKIGEDMLFCLEYLKRCNRIIYGKEVKYHYVNNVLSATKKTFNIDKLTYFKSINIFINYAKDNNLKYLFKKLKEQKVYHAVGFLRQIAESNFKDKRIIKNLQNKVRNNIFLHLFSKHKLSNKLFALSVCINFNLTKYIYNLLLRK